MDAVFPEFREDAPWVSFYTLLFHSLFKVEFDMDHFALGEHRER